MSVLSQDDCTLLVTLINQLNYKLPDARKVLAILDKLQSAIDGKVDISIADKDGKVKEVK